MQLALSFDKLLGIDNPVNASGSSGYSSEGTLSQPVQGYRQGLCENLFPIPAEYNLQRAGNIPLVYPKAGKNVGLSQILCKRESW